jgi:competence protein ComEA
MERRRPGLDPLLAEHVSDRLALVLADRVPRRAQADSQPAPPPEVPPPDIPQPDIPPPNPPTLLIQSPAGQPPVAPSLRPGPAPVGHGQDGPDRPAPDRTLRIDARTTGDRDSPDLDMLDTLDGLPARRFSRVHLTVLGGLVIVALLIAGWSLLRARPVAVATPGAVVIGSSAPASSPLASSAPSSAKPSIVVHVMGAVRRPGLVTLPEPARVQDAIDAAGGFKSGADPGELNLAQQLTDGQQVVIGSKSHPAGEVRNGGGSGGGTGGGTGGGSSGGGGASTVLDLNRATSAQLEALPGVGPVTAGKILAWRQEHSRFSRIEELQEVDGIGPKTYAQIAPHVRV